MRKIINYMIILLFSIKVTYAQVVENKSHDLDNLPKEFLNVHLNSTTFFVGEYVLFKIYNLQSLSNNLSDISKVAYVALVNKEGEVLFNQPISLKKRYRFWRLFSANFNSFW